MGNIKKYHYFVEGECEKKLINVLKEQKNLIIPGRVEILNVTQERLTDLKLRTLSTGTILIFVFDTDIEKTDVLKENLELLSKETRFKTVWCVMQVPNLEGELIKATNIKNIKDLLGSNSLKEFKEEFIKEKNLYSKLCKKEFRLEKMWDSKPGNAYKSIHNDGDKIKLGKKVCQ